MLFAGPYSNEFGHELFSFQGRVRALAKEHEEVIVCSNPSMRFLYEDCITDFISYKKGLDLSAYHKYSFLTQEDCAVGSGSGFLGIKQEFIKYGQLRDEKYDVIIHARTKAPIMCPNVDDNVYDSLYEILSKRYKIAFIGTKTEAYCPPRAEDLREIELKKLADVLRNSRLVVGHSSGPIHFASLCGAPHLTWGGYRPRTFFRYAHTWNPFKTKCYIFENLDELGYLKSRARRFRAPKRVFEEEHVNIINEKDYRVPTLDTLVKNITSILNG